MAANTDVEPVVNRWITEYYACRAIECFKEKNFEEFDAIRTQLSYVLTCPVENSDVTVSMVEVVHFLSRINEGENLGLTFEAGDITPLESALLVLEEINNTCRIPSEEFKDVSTSIKEMIVRVFIKNEQFEKAQEMLNKLFPTSFGKKSVFMGLIKQKSKAHKIIEQLNFQRFKEDMVDFCQRVTTSSTPFLYKAAKQLIESREPEIVEEAAECCGENDPRLSCVHVSTVQLGPRCSVIQKTRIESAYKALALAAGIDTKTFAQLEDEVDQELRERGDPSPNPSSGHKKHTSVYSELESQLQKEAGSPMEGSPADQLQQTDAASETQAESLTNTTAVLRSRRPYSVARLVVEPDSQPCSQVTTTSPALKELVGPEISTEAPAQEKITIPTNKHPRSARKCSKRHRDTRSPSWEEESSALKTNLESNNQNSNSISGNSKLLESSADDEEEHQESVTSLKTPEPIENPQNQNSSTTDDLHITDASLDSSSGQEHPAVPQQSSTPHKASAKDQGPSGSKWKALYNNAKESKETWSDDESFFTTKKSSGVNESLTSNSGQKRKKWSEAETKKLKDGVQRFGEGNWNKIKSYYSFHDRTNVNLKDRWRTIQKQNV